MKTLKVQVRATDKNFSAFLENKDINGVVVVTAKTLEKLKEAFVSALGFHLQGCIEDGDVLPNYIVNKDYLLRYDLDVSSALLQMKSLVSVPVISRGYQHQPKTTAPLRHRTPQTATSPATKDKRGSA